MRVEAGRVPARAARRAIAAVLTAAVLFGTAGTARELGPDDASPLSVGATRIVVGTFVLWLAVVVERRLGEGVAAPPFRRRRLAVLVGGAGVAAYTPLFFVAVDRLGVAMGTVVTIASGPFFAGTIESVLWRRPPTRVWLAGTTVTAGGTALLVASGGHEGGSADAWGILAALAAGLGYATYSITAKSAIEGGLDATRALAEPFTLGALAVVAMAVPTQSFAWVATPSGAAMAAYLGVFATGLAYVLFGQGLRGLTPSTTVTLVLAEPVTAALLAAVVLDESISLPGWAGIAAVVVGLWIVGRDVPASSVSSDGTERGASPPVGRP